MGRSGPRHFRNPGVPFPTGVRKGNVMILTMLERGSVLAETIYLVEYLCCGTRVVFTHERLRKRCGQFDTLCKDCRALGGPAREREAGVIIEYGPMRGYWGYLGKLGPRYGY